MSLRCRPRYQAVEISLASTPVFTGLKDKGLLTKYHLTNGSGGSGGFYAGETKEHAKAWYAAEWSAHLAETCGVKPSAVPVAQM